MTVFTYKITDADGIHARPAGKLSKKASEYDSSVTVSYNGKDADTRRIIALMQLGIKCGDTVTFKLDGGNESDNAKDLRKFLEENGY